MSNYADNFEPASFGGIEFPYERIRVGCGIRHHQHEYPHQPGAALEKLGRELYTISAAIPFQAELSEPRYKDLFPTRLTALRDMWEKQVTDQFNVPAIGKIKCVCIKWGLEQTNRNVSGVAGECEWLEDMEDSFGFLQSLQPKVDNSMKTVLLGWNAELEKIQPHSSIFDSITQMASQILAYKDQFDMYAHLIEAKILGLTSLLHQADAQAQELNQPQYPFLLEAFRELAHANAQLHRDIMQIGYVRLKYTVRQTMSLAQIASDIYGDNRRASDLLKLNALPDPYMVPGGTVIQFYDVRQAA